MALDVEQWMRFVDAQVLGEGDAAELIDGRAYRRGSLDPYVFSPDQVAGAAALGIELGLSWLDVIAERADLRAALHERLA